MMQHNGGQHWCYVQLHASIATFSYASDAESQFPQFESQNVAV